MSEEAVFDCKIKLKIKVTQQDIDDIMVGALEGGINYWCEKVDVFGEYLGDWASEQISRGGSLRFYLKEAFEEGDKRIYRLGRNKFLEGLKKWILFKGADAANCIENGEIDTCNIDASDADAIIQFALFDDIIFG